MKYVSHLHLGLLLGFLMLVGCARRPDPTAGPITELRALDIAKLEFGKQGRKLEDYSVTVRYDTEEGEWVVAFDLKGDAPIPGGRDWVTVHKRTGKATLHEGE